MYETKSDLLGQMTATLPTRDWRTKTAHSFTPASIAQRLMPCFKFSQHFWGLRRMESWLAALEFLHDLVAGNIRRSLLMDAEEYTTAEELLALAADKKGRAARGRQIDPVDHNTAAKMVTSTLDANAMEWMKGSDRPGCGLIIRIQPIAKTA